MQRSREPRPVRKFVEIVRQVQEVTVAELLKIRLRESHEECDRFGFDRRLYDIVSSFIAEQISFTQDYCPINVLRLPCLLRTGQAERGTKWTDCYCDLW